MRYTYDNNYFDDRYQGIPKGGYTAMVERMLDGVEVELNTGYSDWIKRHGGAARKVVYTGAIDEYFGYCLGNLEYRTLKFETQVLDVDNYQGNAVVNYTDEKTPYTRIIEHKHFEFGTQKETVITREYPSEWAPGAQPFYPINDEKNEKLYTEYKKLAEKEKNVIFGGRLGSYRYYDMDKAIKAALECAKREL